MKEGDKEKLMGQRIISGADVTWEQYWEVYAVGGPSHDEVLRALKINISSDNLQNIEQFAGDPSAADYQAKFMQAVEELKKQNPDAIYGETTKLTRAATQNEFEVEVADDEPDSYEMYIENRVKPKLASPLQPLRDAAARAKDKIVTAFEIPTLPKRQKPVKASKQNVPSLHTNEFAETENNRDDIFASFGDNIEDYRNSAYVQSEAAKLKHDRTVRAVPRDSVEELLDDLRNAFLEKWFDAQISLRDKSPEKNQEKNYRNIMNYANALNNILKACAEKSGDPEWVPDAKLIAPLQWMLIQRPNDPELKVLYMDVMVNMMLARRIPGVDNKQLFDFNNAFKEAMKDNNYTAAYEYANILIEVTLKSSSDPTARVCREYLQQARAELAKHQPKLLDPEEVLAEVERQLADEAKAEAEAKASEQKASEPRATMRSSVIAGDTSVTWELYWNTYDEALGDLPSADYESERARSFEAHRRTGLILSIDIKNLEDNQRTVFVSNEQTPENYKQSFMDMVVEKNLARSEKAAHAERAEKNAAKLKNLIAELNDMNSKNFSEFISDKTISTVMGLLQQYPKDRMVKEFVSLYMQAVSYFKQIAALEDVDPIERAGKIADLLLQDGGRAFQVIVAFTSFENVVSSRYAAEPNPKNKPDIAQRNMEKLQLGGTLIKPFQWLLKYKLHLPLINELFNVEDMMKKFEHIGVQANSYQREIAPLVKQMEQVATLENSGKLTTEKTREIINIAQRINRLMPGLEPLEEKISSDSDTGSPERSTTPVTSEGSEEDSYDYDDESDDDPVVIQAPGDLDIDIREDVELQSVPADYLVQSYQQMRKEFAQGYFEKAKNLLLGIYATMVQAKQPNALGGDVFLDKLVKVVQQSQPTNFDVRMGSRLAEIFSDGGEDAYFCSALSIAVKFLEEHKKLLPTSDNKTVELYNKIHELFKNNPDPFTMRGPRDLIKAARAYREISRLDIGTIANAILQDNKLADAFFKRRLATRLPGRRNFRKEFAEHPELLEKLIDSRDPVILASMRDMGLLQTSHLSESNRSRLIKLNTFLNDIETFDGLTPIEKKAKENSPDFKDGLLIRAQKFIAEIHRDESVLDKYLADKFFINVLIKNPTLIQNLVHDLGQSALEKIEAAELVYKAVDHYAKSLPPIGDEVTVKSLRQNEAVLQLMVEKNSVEERSLLNAINNRIFDTPPALRIAEESSAMTSYRDREKKAEREASVNEAWQKEYGKYDEPAEASKVKFAEDTNFDPKEKPKRVKVNELSQEKLDEDMERMSNAALDNLKNKKPGRSALKGGRDESILQNQDMLQNAAENLEKMKPQETVADLIAELEALKLGEASNNEHQQACIELLDKINNKQLANLLKEKVTQHPSEKFPDLDQMKAFVKDINDNLKVEQGVGLDYKRYLTLLADAKYDAKFTGLFNLEKDNFPVNNKGFQRPLPLAPSVQAKNSDTPKPPHQGGK